MIFHKITRQALHDLVGAKPMMKVAADFGITGTGLKKISARNDVPTPEKGYWNKLAYGKLVIMFRPVASTPSAQRRQFGRRWPGVGWPAAVIRNGRTLGGPGQFQRLVKLRSTRSS
jgi:hypothetical protein